MKISDKGLKLVKALTVERLRYLLTYMPETGVFKWNVSTSPIAPIGSVAGSRPDHGYVNIQIDGKMYRAHRLAWLYMTGEWPALDVDHINRVKSDNRWENLRLANDSQNKANGNKYKNNTSGVTGVHFYRQTNRWHAVIASDGKRRSLGYYASFDDAVKARREAEIIHHGEFRPS